MREIGRRKEEREVREGGKREKERAGKKKMGGRGIVRERVRTKEKGKEKGR